MGIKPYRLTATKPKLNILLYAPPGTGKTTFAATAQDHKDMKDVLFINAESGTLSIAGRGDIQAVDVKTAGQLEEVFHALANKSPGFENIGTAVIDSGSDLQASDLEHLVHEAMTKVSKSGRKRSDADEVWQEDYGKSTVRFRRLFRWFRDLPIHVVITALAKTTYPQNAGNNPHIDPISVSPAFTNKLGESVMGYVDFVWYMYADKEGNRYLLTQERGVYKAKTRGVEFPKALGERVKLEPGKPWLPGIYDLLVKTESATPNPKKQ